MFPTCKGRGATKGRARLYHIGVVTEGDVNWDVAERAFHKAARLFQKVEDKEDFIHECWLALVKYSRKNISVKLIIKEAMTTFFENQRGARKGKDREILLPSDLVGKVVIKDFKSLGELLDLGIPSNPNDYLASIHFIVTINGNRTHWDRDDLAEALNVTTRSLKTFRIMKRDIKRFRCRQTSRIFSGVAEAARFFKCRQSTAKQRLDEIIVKWC